MLKLDHLERARRENERDLLEKVYEQQKEQDKQRWEVESKQFMENHKKKHEEDIEVKRIFFMKTCRNSVSECEYDLHVGTVIWQSSSNNLSK